MANLAALIERAGAWRGTNGFRLMPDDPVHEAPATVVVTARAGGHLVSVAYSWAHPDDGPQEGYLVVGSAGDDGAVTALWADSWHQHPDAAVLAGSVDGAVLRVGYEYAPGWRWEIVLDPTDPDSLLLRMDNVVPADAAAGQVASTYSAMRMDLGRPSS